MNKTTELPKGYCTAMPYLIIKDAGAAIEFYKKAFNAKEKGRISTLDGKILHAEIEIGDSIVRLGDEAPWRIAQSPKSLGGTSVFIHLYVENADKFLNQAIAAGAKIRIPIKDQFYGDRSGSIEDPFGHTWTIATHKEDMSFQEMQKRLAALNN